MIAAAQLAEESITLVSALTIAFAALGEVLAIVFVYRVLVRGGSPASNLLWVVVILAAPWIGLLLYYLMPRRLQLRRLKRIERRGERARRAMTGPPGSELDIDERDAGLMALLDSEEGGGLCGGNEVEWIPGAEESFEAAADAIRAARRQVHCEVYILRPDESGLRFLELLTAAAGRGVEVRLLFDSIGSFGLKSSQLAPLRAAGGRAEGFMPLLWKRRPFTINLRNHRKSLIVDGEIGFVGGRNIADEYRTGRLGRTRRWLDSMVRVRGPVVAELQHVFVEDWCTATDELIEDLPPTPEGRGSELAAVTCSGPDRDRQTLWYALVQAIAEARESVHLSSPYMLPPPMLFFALEMAVARGVRVRLYTNGRAAEAAVLYWAQRSYYRRLLQIGAEIYETKQDYNHSKLLVVDSRTVIVGSANMDRRSAELNFEIALVVVDAPKLAEKVLETMSERQAGRQLVTQADLPTNPIWRAIDGLSSLASPLL